MRTTTHNFTKFCPVTRKRILDVARASERFRETHCEGGVLRWTSNGHVPPQDCLEDFREAGLGSFDMEASKRVRDRETMAFLAEYKAADTGHTDEELCEMRAAFGEGVTIVNVVTGRRTKL